MPDLIAKATLGLAPVTRSDTTLSEAGGAQITGIAPYPGQTAAVSAAMGIDFPAPNQVTTSGTARLVWTGRDLAYLIGAPPPVTLPTTLPAALTDQSDAWVTLTLTGPLARPVLARLVPLDLKTTTAGHCARSALSHLPLILICNGPDDFTLMTFRSMAKSAWHELTDALEKVAARTALTP